jgi:hypothetical protein
MGRFRSKWITFAWIALIAAIVASNVLAVRHLRMETAPLSPRYTDYAIPAAISALRGLTDYTAYMEVAGQFIFHKDRPVADGIAAALDVKLKNPADRWFVSGDDKCLIDLVYLGFLHFGTFVSSIYLVVGLLCLASIVLYIVEFYRSGPKLALLVATLAGFYAVLFTFGINSQSSSIIEPRFLGFIGIIPLLHTTMLVIEGRRYTYWSLARMTAQIAAIMFVVHLRGSELWQVVSLLAACLGSILVFKRLRRIGAAAMAIVLILGAGAITYRDFKYNPYYLRADVSGRVFWHNMVMGLSANSEIRRRFKIDLLNDSSITEAIRHYLATTGRTKQRDVIFPRDDYAQGNFYRFKWSMYEPVAREFYFHILETMPVEVLKTYFVVVPKIYAASLSYMAGGAFLKDYLFVAGPGETPLQRVLRDHYLKPLRILPIMFTLASALLLAFGGIIVDRPAIAAIAIATAASSIPPWLVMPVIQYSQLFTMLIFAGAYFLAMMIVATLLGRIHKHLAFAKRGPTTEPADC